MKLLKNSLWFLIGFLFTMCNHNPDSTKHNKELFVFAGAATMPALSEAIISFEKQNDIKVFATYGGSGYVLSQMKVSRKGDIYLPGSSDFMRIAEKDSIIIPSTEKVIAYLVPSIVVQKGNPLGITSISDLCNPGVKLIIANPEGVCLGTFAVELFENNLSDDQIELIRNNIINYTESCSKTETAISLKNADAVIGWSIFGDWDSDRSEAVMLPQEELSRIGYIPAAITQYSTNREFAEKFINFLTSDEGKAIFRRHHYFMTEREVFNKIGSEKPVGGEYTIPARWISK